MLSSLPPQALATDASKGQVSWSLLTINLIKPMFLVSHRLWFVSHNGFPNLYLGHFIPGSWTVSLPDRAAVDYVAPGIAAHLISTGWNLTLMCFFLSLRTLSLVALWQSDGVSVSSLFVRSSMIAGKFATQVFKGDLRCGRWCLMRRLDITKVISSLFCLNQMMTGVIDS